MTIQQAFNEQLTQFPEAGRALLAEIVMDEGFAGVIPVAQAQLLASQMGLSVAELMHVLVPIARCYAYPPISTYYVGAVVRGTSGNLYFGGNLEFPGLALNMTIHGEQAAVVNARLHGETGLDALAVNGTPCGHCRQFLAEINNPNLAIVQRDGSSQRLAEVLPNAFMPRALGNERGLLERVDSEPTLTLDNDDVLSQEAVRMARQSYAPYSNNLAGVAVRLENGRIFTGPYLESVAFNPSLSPLHTVLVALNLHQQPWQSIAEAVLVEKGDSLSSQKQVCRALLATLGEIELRYHTLN